MFFIYSHSIYKKAIKGENSSKTAKNIKHSSILVFGNPAYTVLGDYAGWIYVSVSTRQNIGDQDPAQQFPNLHFSYLPKRVFILPDN